MMDFLRGLALVSRRLQSTPFTFLAEAILFVAEKAILGYAWMRYWLVWNDAEKAEWRERMRDAE
jgi:hypothetical protein